MGSVSLYMGSVTNAMRGKALLEKRGILSEITRTVNRESSGCGFSLRVSADYREAVKMLQAAGISVRGVGLL